MFYNLIPERSSVMDVKSAASEYMSQEYDQGGRILHVDYLGKGILSESLVLGETIRLLEATINGKSFHLGHGITEKGSLLFDMPFLDYASKVLTDSRTYYFSVRGLNHDNIQVPLFNEIYGELYKLTEVQE